MVVQNGYTIGPYWFAEVETAVLGRGNFGCVYKGFHCTDRSLPAVAVKKIDNSKLKQSELAILSLIKSEFVVTLLGLYAIDGFTYFVLELCDCDLDSYLKQVSTLRLENLRTLTTCLAKGYFDLHRMEIIHRDIKPQNILLKFAPNPPELDDQGINRREIAIAKFSDFGVSREVKKGSGITLSNLAGTPLYMAPEVGANILDSQDYDAQVDMWSIGVMLNQCITGEEPFDERALCKLFLFASNKNYEGYQPPPLPESTPEMFQQLNKGLLEIDYTKRITPETFHSVVVGGNTLIGENNVAVRKGSLATRKNSEADTITVDNSTMTKYFGGIFSFFSNFMRTEFVAPTVLLTCTFCLLPRLSKTAADDSIVQL